MLKELSEAERLVGEAILSCSLPARHPDGTAYDADVDDGHDFETLGFDSLTCMEFCIALHCACGVELSIEDMARLRTPRGVAAFLAERV